ncbi:hypothetical protein HDU87_008865 [Geranomyces variabilis]|uniref:BZIP domain-containing protein n=1 Tax=Geranomyces variabilis TaxID=109894 RepID=A0AAD5TCZ9_9FUNG|nr:hypothetical protein HDU87_008865 [Geranomyces variabilis]
MHLNDVPNLDLDQFLGVTQADLDLYATPFDAAIAAQDATAWIPDNEMLDQLELLTAPSESAAASPAFSTIHDPYMFSPSSQACDADAFFNATSPMTSAGDFGVVASPATAQYQDSPMALSIVESPPQFGVPVQAADQGWGFTEEGALFPALYSPSAPAKPAVAIRAKSPVQQQATARPPSAAASVKPIAPMPSSLLPLLNTIGPTAAQLALSPAALAAASAATGVDVKQLQQQLQAFAAMQARQATAGAAAKPSSPTEVAAAATATSAPAATNRKRKERPVDADALFAELDMKRQKNTEAARRSRQKKQERMAELEAQVRQLESERDSLKAEKEEGAVREMNYLAIISAMQQKLCVYEGAS